MTISASTIYNYLQCPHRPWRDKFGPQDEKIQETNPFVELLWQRGVLYEKEVIEELGTFEDISKLSYKERAKETKEALKNEVDLIYQGVLEYRNLRGIPDLLKRSKDHKYIAIDIKSGRGLEGVTEDDPCKPKNHYALQLCLYTEILEKLGLSAGRKGKIIDIDSNVVEYDLTEKIGKRTDKTYWELYIEIKNELRELLSNKKQNDPALFGGCKLCPWYSSCLKWIKGSHDFTNLFYVGRSKRDRLREDLDIKRYEDILKYDMKNLLERKKLEKGFLKDIGKKTLEKIFFRSEMLHLGREAVIHKKITFPEVANELFFDIEDDPTQGFVYLHGVYEKSRGEDKFHKFIAKELTDKAEKEAWQKFWDFIERLPKNNFALYYYASHEKTMYRLLQEKYSDIITEQELDDFFENPNVIDLYSDVILPNTDWPLSSYSLKSIADYLGFKWRDESPSGALSIQWFNEYIEKKDTEILERIVEYNEDDCKATMVVKEGIADMQNKALFPGVN